MKLISPDIANKILKNYDMEGYTQENFTFGELELPKGAEYSHILATGTTGSGKTNLLNHLIKQIRNRDEKAIIIDSNSDFYKRFFKTGDKLLNPFEGDSEYWNFWSEGVDNITLKAIAASIIPEPKYQDPFWINSAQMVFSSILEQAHYKEKIITNQALREFLNSSSQNDILKLLEGSKAYKTLANNQNNQTASSILTTMYSHIEEPLSILQDGNNHFSVNEWVKSKDKGSFLFITAEVISRDILKPLMSMWFSFAAKAAMSGGDNQKIWFVIDELTAMSNLASLKTLVAEGRKYNIAVVIAFQSIKQVMEVYGSEGASSIIGNINTMFFFRGHEYESNIWASKILGEYQAEKFNESISFGASSVRDGVSIGYQNMKDSLIIPSDIASLKPLEAYVKLPFVGDKITKTSFSYFGVK